MVRASALLSVLTTAALALAVVASPAAAGAPLATGSPAPVAGVANPDMLVGASTSDWAWFDQAVGPVQVYRHFDGGFGFATWKATKAYKLHPNAPMYDYSTKLLPQRLTNPADPINAQYRAFLATTPKNIIITNFHEPDNETTALFTPAQFRAGILALDAMVNAQNAADGGTRMTAVTLMNITFGTYSRSRAIDWWPTVARDGGTVDIIQTDAYALPHLTNTQGIPSGYTSGQKWTNPQGLLGNITSFASTNHTPWAVAELGYLEDVNNRNRRSTTIGDVVAYARANGAHHISYFDNKGPRADWRLRWSSPIGSTSANSLAVQTWKAAVAAAG